MQNPFSTTFSKLPEYTYIPTEEPREIIENFSYESPTESVYKITGIRGSGKTVILANIHDKIRSKEFADNGWIVYSLNPGRDMLVQFAAALNSEKFIRERAKSISLNLSASVFGTGGGVGFSKQPDDRFFDVGVEIGKMLEVVRELHKKILICVDDVSKTQDMVVFAHEFSGWLFSGFPVYFVCTGLYENVMELGNTKNLTFFRRGTTVATKPLNYIRMSEMYKSRLSVDADTSKKMASITRGYAYAFQQLGAIYFRRGNDASFEEMIDELKSELFAYSYEKIWEELSGEDRFLASLLTAKEEYKREEVLSLMGDKSKGYSVYRDRLLKRGVITGRQGYIGLNPPFFAEYVREYGMI
ncbi:MAG: hypothetical protein IK152_10105 [Lachnospiraceae bacterium]|nr:hypothetical protein [Lachnospiraceae bacterium]